MDIETEKGMAARMAAALASKDEQVIFREQQRQELKKIRLEQERRIKALALNGLPEISIKQG